MYLPREAKIEGRNHPDAATAPEDEGRPRIRFVRIPPAHAVHKKI